MLGVVCADDCEANLSLAERSDGLVRVACRVTLDDHKRRFHGIDSIIAKANNRGLIESDIVLIIGKFPH